MAVRLEIGWRPELTDAEGEGVRRKAREYFGLELHQVRVLRVLMLDLDLSATELEQIRTEIFTHPTTQISGFRPLAQSLDFDWAVWVGFKQTGVEYRRAARFTGETKYPFKKMFKFAFPGDGSRYFPVRP